MSEIYVNLERLDDTADKCKDIADKLDQIKNRFNSVSRSIDWELRSKSSVTRAINTLSKQLDDGVDTLNKHYSFFRNAKSVYMDADSKEKAESSDLAIELYSGESKTSSSNSFSDMVDKFIDKLSEKGFLGILKEYGKYSVGLSFLSAILNIGTKFKNYYNKYITGISSIPAFLIDTVGTGISSFATWTKSVFTFDKFLKAAKGVTALKDTALQKFCSYAPVINVPFKFFQTAFESYDEYAADGDYSMTDFAATLIDSSVSGLFAVASGAAILYTGPSALISGVLTGGTIVLDSANSGFDLDKKASTYIKDWAANAGQELRKSDGKITPATAIYSSLYGIGWAATNAVNKVENICSTITGLFN